MRTTLATLATALLLGTASAALGPCGPAVIAGHGDMEALGAQAGHGDMEALGAQAGHGDVEALGAQAGHGDIEALGAGG